MKDERKDEGAFILQNPFPGLRPFRADEHHLFFGREDQTAALLQLLRQKRFLAVVGTSGSGKSSLVRAGMIPELYGGTMTQAGSTWEVILLRPGGSPIENLARAIVDADLYDGEDPETLPRLLATLRRSRFGLVEAIKQSDVFEPGANLLVVVDQFEELFRFRQQGVGAEEAAASFVNLLLTASEQAECPIYVTLTMRSDYLGDCSEIPGLAEAVNEGEYLIPRLLRDQKRDAIEKPIGVGGAKISPLLVQRLLNDVGDDPDQLPVLQHALMRMWDVWSAGSDHDRPIEFENFEATGGLAAALSNHADEIYAALPDEQHRTVCERVFKTLTEKAADNRGIRRPTRLSQLEAIAAADRVTMTAVLDAYRKSGVTFVMPGAERDLQDQTVLDLSHESLMRGWQRLRSWVEDEAQSARIFRRLSDTASLWQNGKAGLFRDPDLQVALSWRDQQQASSDWAEQYGGQFQMAMGFLNASSAAAAAEQEAKEAARQHELEQARQLAEARQLQLEQQQRSARKLRKLIAGLAVVAVLAGFACVAALIANNNANRLAHRADQEAGKANENAQQAERAEQEARQAEQAARAAEEAGRKLLYTTDMRLAPFVWSDDRSTAEQLRSLLAKHSPERMKDEGGRMDKTGSSFIPHPSSFLKPDLRGFEWYYYQHLLDSSAAVFSGHGTSVIGGAFAADGQLMTLDQSGQARRWNLDSRDEVEASRRDLPNGRDAQIRLLSPDGRLAALAEGKQVHVFDTTTGKENFQVESAFTIYRRLTFSRDSDRLVIVDDKIRWCDASSGQVMATFDHKFGRRDRLALSADGLTLAIVSHGPIGNLFSVFQRDPAVGKLTPQGQDINHVTHVSAAALNPDGTLIVAGAMYGSVTVFDTATGRLISKHGSAHASVVSAISFSRDGLKLATADNEGTIKIWEDVRTLNSQSSASMTLKGHQGRITSVDFSSDGKQLVSTSDDKSARVWDLANVGAAIRPLQRSGVDCYVARFSPDGLLAAAADGSSLRLWDAATGQLVRELSAGDKGRVFSVAFSPTHSHLLAVGYGGQADISHVSLWDIDAGVELARLPGATDLPDFSLSDWTSVVGALAFSPDGKYLVAGFGPPHIVTSVSSSSPLKVWEVATRRLIRLLNAHSGFCVSLAFSPDGTRLASGSRDGTAIIWSTDTWKATQTLRNPDRGRIHSQAGGEVDDVAFSPDGNTLAMASLGGNIQLWNVATGKHLETLKGHSNEVTAVAFSPDGRTLASGSIDQTVRLWSVASWRALMQLDSGSIRLGSVETLSFSPDGKHLLAGGRGNTVIWSTAPVVWNDPERAAANLQLLLDSNADFPSRIRMFSENLRLHEALEKLDTTDLRVRAALAATRANWHASQGRWAEAAEEFDRLRELRPDTSQAWLRTPGLIRVAQALAERDRPAVAAELLAGGVQRSSADGAVVGEQITSLHAAVSQQLTGNQHHVGLLKLRAELAGQLSRWSEQVADYTAAIEALGKLQQGEATGDLTRLYRRRGDAHVALNNWQLVVDDYAHVVTPQTRDPELFSNRARAYEELHNWQAAANDWARATAANSDGAALHVEFARRLMKSGQFALAAREREKSRRLHELALQADPYGPIPAEQLAQLRFEMSEPKWTILKPTEMKSVGGATLSLQDDGSILAGSKNPPSDRYQFVIETDQRTVTALRLEALLDDSLPGHGPGRGFGGTFALVWFDVRYQARSPGSEVQPLGLGAAVANRQHAPYPITPRAWNIGPGGFPGDAYFDVAPAIHSDSGFRFTFTMQFQRNPQYSDQNLGRFRLLVSDDALAFRHARIRFAAMKMTDPWEKLTAAYHLLDDGAGLEKLLRFHPLAAAVIGDLSAAQKDWEQAIAEYTKLITAGTIDAAVLAKRAAAYVATEQWDLAQADWMRAIQHQPGLAQSAFERLKQAGRWSEAARFGLMLVEQMPDDSQVWLGVAPVLVLAGSEADYSEFCRRMAQQFVETQDFRNAANTCTACLLRPNTIDLAQLPGITLAKTQYDGTGRAWSPSLAYSWSARALLAYRSGDAASAVKYSTRSVELDPSDLPRALSLAIRALAQHQLGQQEEARSALDEASEIVNRLQLVVNNKGNQNLLIAQILLREAEAKIK